MDDIIRIIAQIDVPQAQVVIQVLVAEVDLANNEEFGVEIGLQSPVLFQRSIVPLPTAIGSTGSITYNGNPVSATGLGPQVVNNGVTVNTSANPTAFPGFNFTNPNLPLGNNPLANPGIVGLQGLGNLGVGRVSPTNGGRRFCVLGGQRRLQLAHSGAQGPEPRGHPQSATDYDLEQPDGVPQHRPRNPFGDRQQRDGHGGGFQQHRPPSDRRAPPGHARRSARTAAS